MILLVRFLKTIFLIIFKHNYMYFVGVFRSYVFWQTSDCCQVSVHICWHIQRFIHERNQWRRELLCVSFIFVLILSLFFLETVTGKHYNIVPRQTFDILDDTCPIKANYSWWEIRYVRLNQLLRTPKAWNYSTGWTGW